MHKNNHKLRIGIVGAGDIVRTRHLPALKENSEVEIVAVSNSTYESSERFCRENSLAALPMRDWAELVATPDIDIVMTNEAYRERYNRDNPNIAIIHALKQAGVDIRVCGQGLLARKIDGKTVITAASIRQFIADLPKAEVGDAAQVAEQSVAVDPGHGNLNRDAPRPTRRWRAAWRRGRNTGLQDVSSWPR